MRMMRGIATGIIAVALCLPANAGNPDTKPDNPNAGVQQAFQKGYQDGLKKGRVEGRIKGLRDGQNKGRREGEKKGKRDGWAQGFFAGRRDGEREGMDQGRQQGREDGISKGTLLGKKAGEKRCFNEGYSEGREEGYQEGYNSGLNSDGYDRGYAKGCNDAQETEQASGTQAGYKAGFAEREAEIRDSFGSETDPVAESRKSLFSHRDLDVMETELGDLEVFDENLAMLKAGQTPQQKEAYKKGYRKGYKEGYDRAYKRAEQKGYNETYQPSYDRAYRRAYQNSYNIAFGAAKDHGFKEAYRNTYDRYYDEYYRLYKNQEYSYERQRGYNDGFPEGREKGYSTAYNKVYNKGYKEGYDKTAAEVYPAAYETGKSDGIAACQKYYEENAVLEITNLMITDGNADGIYQTGDEIKAVVEIANYGFVHSMAITLPVTCQNEGVTLNGAHAGEAIEARKTGSISFTAGIVAEEAIIGTTAALKVEIQHAGSSCGFKVMEIELYNENQKIGLVNAGSVNVRQGPGMKYKVIDVVHKSNSIAVIGMSGNWYRVVTPKGRYGYIYKNLVDVEWPPVTPVPEDVPVEPATEVVAQ